jgi:hypothetical protein
MLSKELIRFDSKSPYLFSQQWEEKAGKVASFGICDGISAIHQVFPFPNDGMVYAAVNY